MATDGDGDGDEDDYLTMTFDQTSSSHSGKESPLQGTARRGKESSLQRAGRLRQEAAERARVPTKAEQVEKYNSELLASLNRPLPPSNKGAQMLRRMGYKGGALGKDEDGRTEPVGIVLVNDRRAGLGLESERKRKFAETMAAAAKWNKVSEEGYVEHVREVAEDKHAQTEMWAAMKTLESIEGKSCGGDAAAAAAEQHGGDEAGQMFDDGAEESGEGEGATEPTSNSHRVYVPLRSVNILYRSLVKQRFEKEKQGRMTQDPKRPRFTRWDLNDPTDDQILYGKEPDEYLIEEDPELEDFEALSFADRLQKIVKHLRQEHHYCFWCKYKYPDESMDGCPGPMEDEHG